MIPEQNQGKTEKLINHSQKQTKAFHSNFFIIKFYLLTGLFKTVVFVLRFPCVKCLTS